MVDLVIGAVVVEEVEELKHLVNVVHDVLMSVVRERLEHGASIGAA